MKGKGSSIKGEDSKGKGSEGQRQQRAKPVKGKGSEGQDIPGEQVIPGAAQGVGKVRDEGPAGAVLQRLLITRPPLLSPPLPPYQQVLQRVVAS